MHLNFEVRPSNPKKHPSKTLRVFDRVLLRIVAGYTFGLRKDMSKFTNPVKLAENLRVMKWSAAQSS